MEKGIRILLFSVDPQFSEIISAFLEKEKRRFLITTIISEEKNNFELKDKKWDVIIICRDIPGNIELNIIQTIRLSCPFVPVMIVANDNPVDFATLALKRGVIDFYYISANEIDTLPEKINSAILIKKKVSQCGKAFEELLQKERDIKGILDNIQDAYFRTDEKGYLSMVNHAAVIMFGYETVDEILGLQASFLYSNESDRDELLEQLQKNGKITEFIKKGKRKDGSEFWVSLNAQYLHNEQGKIVGTEGIVRDISERMRNQEEINLKAQLLDNSFDSIIVHDYQGNIIYANENACKLRGYTRIELLKKNINELIVSDFIPKFNSQLLNLKRTDEVRFEMAHIHKDRSILPVEVKIRNIFFEGKALILNSSVDISERKRAVDALIESETRYRDLTESSPIGILTTDLEGIIVYENPAMRRILGIPEGQMSKAIGVRLVDLPNMKNTVFVELFDKVSKGFPIKDIDMPFISIYGIQAFLRINGIPIRNNKGTITGNLLIIQNITEQHKTQEALKREQHLFSNLFDNIPDTIYFKDSESHFVRINNSMSKSFGLESPEEVIGKTDYNFFDEQHAKVAFADEQKIIETGEPMIGKIELAKRLDGILRWVSTTKIPMKDDDGSIIGIMGISRDITDSKRAEEALIQERKLLRTLIENLPSAVFSKDKNYRKVIVNNNHIESVLGHLKQLGKNHEIDILGKTDFEVFPQELAEKFFEDDQKVVREGVSIINNLEFGISRSGEKIWNLVSKIPLRDSDGEIVGLVGITTDITELKRAEQDILKQKEKVESKNKEYALLNEEYKQLNTDLRKSNEELLASRIKAEESDRLKTAFLQNMSHEIRTPMNAIMGFSELLTYEFEDKAKIDRFSKIIYQRSSDLLEIINGILDISKIESGQLPVHIEKFELRPVFYELETTFNEYRKRINKEHVQFSISMKCVEGFSEFNSDKVKLKQIFINLIGNAFKFTENGKIEAGCRVSEKNETIFFVSDTGIGIAKEKHALIFERFMQINDKSLSRVGGTGLGLSIVRGLINLLGGKIWLESEPGVGSTFYFTIANDEIPKMKSME